MTSDRNAPPPAGLSQLDRWQPVALFGAAGAGLGFAAIAADVASSLGWLVPAAVFALITLVMLGADPAGAASVLRRPRFLIAALGLNFVVNPLVAWLLATTLLRGHPDLQTGLVLFLVTPCIGWYLVFTELAGGDDQLGIGLLAINLALQMLLLPLYLWLFVGSGVGTSTTDVARSVVTFLVAPVALAARRRWSAPRGGAVGTASVHLGSRSVTKLAVLMVVIFAMFASQADELRNNFGSVVRLILPVTLFFAIAFLLAVVVGWALSMPYPELSLLVFTTSSRNSEASLAIAVGAFASPLVAATVAIGPIIELPLLVLMVRVLLRLQPRLRRRQKAASGERQSARWIGITKV